jgi:hypothetical protein
MPYLAVRVGGEVVLGVLLEDEAEDLPGLRAALVLQQRLAAQVLRQVALALWGRLYGCTATGEWTQLGEGRETDIYQVYVNDQHS